MHVKRRSTEMADMRHELSITSLFVVVNIKYSVGIRFLSWDEKNTLRQNLSGFSEMFVFATKSHLVQCLL